MKNSAVTVSSNPISSVASSPVLLVILIISLGFNLLVGLQGASSILGEERMDNLVTQFTNTENIREIGSLLDSGLKSFERGQSVKRRKKKRRKSMKKNEKEEELYSYSDLPRLF